MAPVSRPFPRFIAESPHELEPHGRWRTMLEELFRSACKSIEGDEDLGEVGEIVWFPDRTYGSPHFRSRAGADAGRARGVRLRLVHPLGRITPANRLHRARRLHGRDRGGEP